MKNKIKDENEKLEQIEKSTKKELKNYAKDIKETKLNLFDKKPFIQKIIFFATGIESFIIGFALYFMFKDDKKWQSDYLLYGSTFGLAIELIIIAGDILQKLGF